MRAKATRQTVPNALSYIFEKEKSYWMESHSPMQSGSLVSKEARLFCFFSFFFGYDALCSPFATAHVSVESRKITVLRFCLHDASGSPLPAHFLAVLIRFLPFSDNFPSRSPRKNCKSPQKPLKRSLKPLFRNISRNLASSSPSHRRIPTSAFTFPAIADGASTMQAFPARKDKFPCISWERASSQKTSLMSRGL